MLKNTTSPPDTQPISQILCQALEPTPRETVTKLYFNCEEEARAEGKKKKKTKL